MATLGNVAASGFVYVRIPRFDVPEIDHSESSDRCRECEKVEEDEFSLNDGTEGSQVEDLVTDCEHIPLIAEERMEARRRRRSTLVEQARFFRIFLYFKILH